MKIKDLFEAPLPLHSTDIDKYKSRKILAKHGKKLGQGAFGAAYEIPKDVTTVVKTSELNRQSWYADGYFNYVKEIADKTDNPYLPQIYEIRRMQPAGKNKYGESPEPYLLVNTEQLYKGEQFKPDELLLSIRRMMGRELTKTDYKIFLELNHGKKLTTWGLLQVIADALNSYARAKSAKDSFVIADPQLRQALGIVRKLKKKGYVVDLHEQNFMFRRTPYGPQLVLTDPLAWYHGNKYADPKEPVFKIVVGNPK